MVTPFCDKKTCKQSFAEREDRITIIRCYCLLLKIGEVYDCCQDHVKDQIYNNNPVLIYMGDLHLVLPALNLSILDAGILIMVKTSGGVCKWLCGWVRWVAYVILVSVPVPLG